MKLPLSHLATRFIGVPLMMDPVKLEVIIDGLGPRLGIEPSQLQHLSEDVTRPLMAKYQEDQAAERSYQVFGGVAVIPVQGTLMKRSSWMDALSGCCSYMEIEEQLNHALDDPGVNSLLLDIDSPGGEVSGCFELVDKLYSMRGKKPIYAIANDQAASAAYAIASAADRVFVGRTASVGSVGVFALHAEQSELDKNVGVKYSYIFAGKTKVDGNPHSPLSDRARAEIQTEVTREYGIFTETVARNRGVAVKDVVDTDARSLWADAAVPLLADQVGTFDDAMSALLALGGSGSKTRGKAAKTSATAVERITMPETTLAATEPCENEEEIKGEAPKDKKKDPPPASDTDPDGPESKKPAAATPLAGAAAALPGALNASRTVEEITAISNLCEIAGVKGSAYLTKMVDAATGKRFMSVAEISSELAETRSVESGRSALMNTVDTNNAAGGKMTMDRLQVEATNFARANGRVEANNLYVPGKRTGTTPEQAFAAGLEANPEAYEQFRARHNASALIGQLKAAGVKVNFE